MIEYIKSLIASGALLIHTWDRTPHRNSQSQHTQAVLKRRAANKRAAQQRRRNRN